MVGFKGFLRRLASKKKLHSRQQGSGSADAGTKRLF
jgi:hypothetical protein